MSIILEADKLSKRIAEHSRSLVLLQETSLRLHAGETIAIQGPSGAGKSTLLGLLAGLDLPSSGQVRLQGIDLFSLDENARAQLRGRNMGFVFQSFQLLPALTALENVMLPLELNGADNCRAKAEAILDQVGLNQRMQHYPAQLSGGEQQRVAIARAFAPDVPLLLADEPTGNLDQATGAKIIDLLFSLNQQKQTTLVLVTHDPALAGRCSRRFSIENGVLQELR